MTTPDVSPPERVAQLAELAAAGYAEALSELPAALEACPVEGREQLEYLAAVYAPTPEVSRLILTHLIERVAPDDINLLLAAAQLEWLDGQDRKAEEFAVRALHVDGESIDVLRMMALLAKTREEKIAHHQAILNLAPNDREAWDAIIALRATDDHHHDH